MKTLKDLPHISLYDGVTIPDLRNESIQWIKAIRKYQDRDYIDGLTDEEQAEFYNNQLDDFHGNEDSVCRFIQWFFNLTEEDLK